jgi:16S rRNA (guanine527-N7)-methyltransferase
VGSPHEEALERVAAARPARSSLVAYLDLLARWSRRVDLTGVVTPEARVRVLIEPALALLPLLLPGALLDVGSGNGSPGLVLALLDPGRPVTLLEPRARRWAFLREAARACGRGDVHILRARHEQHEGPGAPNLTARALRLDAAALARLLAPGGQALLSFAPPGSRPAPVAAGLPPVFLYRAPDVPRET